MQIRAPDISHGSKPLPGPEQGQYSHPCIFRHASYRLSSGSCAKNTYISGISCAWSFNGLGNKSGSAVKAYPLAELVKVTEVISLYRLAYRDGY